MCYICGQDPCADGCYEQELKVVCECDMCRSDIIFGDKYYKVFKYNICDICMDECEVIEE